MIPRLDLSDGGRAHRQRWPEDAAGTLHRPELFQGRKPYRLIRVMVDADLFDDVPATSYPRMPQDVLNALLRHPLVEVLKFADDGPPAGAAAGPAPGVYEGWAVISDRDDARHQWGVKLPSGPGSWALSGVIGNAVDVAEADVGADAYRDLTPAQAAQRRRADCLAAQVASQAVGADVYVTERPYLRAATWPAARGVTVVSTRGALALLGLYLRAQGEFPVAERFRYNRGLFYWVGARELVPEGWRWFTACVQSSTHTNDEALMLLGGSLFERVNRALEARDALHIALNKKQNNDTQDEALAHLDFVLLSLMGAIDVSARVAHRVLGLPDTEEFKAGWQANRPRGWLARVKAQHPQLAQVVQPGKPGEHALTIVRLLRNSVHGAALQGLAVSRSGQPMENLVGLPVQDEVRLLAAMDALGGQAAWGARPTLPGRTHVDPGKLVDRLFEAVIELLNDLLRNTPVELLAGVSLGAADLGPPPDGPPGRPDSFDSWARSSIRWQLGF